MQEHLGSDRLGTRHGDADAGLDPDLLTGDREGWCQGQQEPLGYLVDLGLAGEAVQQDAELVTAQARRRVFGPQAAQNPVGDRDEQAVTALVTEQVVDLLEAVQVAVQDGYHPSAGPAIQRVGQPVGEHGAVVQPGQGVVAREVGHLVGQPAAAER